MIPRENWREKGDKKKVENMERSHTGWGSKNVTLYSV
jgi:hypothetical protein